MMGSLHTSSGVTFWLESCDGDYVLKQFQQSDFPEEIDVADKDSEDNDVVTDKLPQIPSNTSDRITQDCIDPCTH